MKNVASSIPLMLISQYTCGSRNSHSWPVSPLLHVQKQTEGKSLEEEAALQVMLQQALSTMLLPHVLRMQPGRRREEVPQAAGRANSSRSVEDHSTRKEEAAGWPIRLHKAMSASSDVCKQQPMLIA